MGQHHSVPNVSVDLVVVLPPLVTRHSLSMAHKTWTGSRSLAAGGWGVGGGGRGEGDTVRERVEEGQGRWWLFKTSHPPVPESPGELSQEPPPLQSLTPTTPPSTEPRKRGLQTPLTLELSKVRSFLLDRIRQ